MLEALLDSGWLAQDYSPDDCDASAGRMAMALGHRDELWIHDRWLRRRGGAGGVLCTAGMP